MGQVPALKKALHRALHQTEAQAKYDLRAPADPSGTSSHDPSILRLRSGTFGVAQEAKANLPEFQVLNRVEEESKEMGRFARRHSPRPDQEGLHHGFPVPHRPEGRRSQRHALAFPQGKC